MSEADVFQVSRFPDPAAEERYAALIGLDDFKARIVKEAEILLVPKSLKSWNEKFHSGTLAAVREFGERTPLFVFAGDVGTGKTELAETFGAVVQRSLRIPITLMKLTLNARGSGRVGEMTQLLSSAFRTIEERMMGQKGADEPTAATILVIDEADALAQSRELGQMHHEDRAGVNALIHGISHLANERLPVLTVMCTNRVDALDPAVRRRAAAVLDFKRPDDPQRRAVLQRALAGTQISERALDELVQLTGPTAQRPYGYTYSDLRGRLIPAAVLDAYPDKPLNPLRVRELIPANPPTPPFSGA